MRMNVTSFLLLVSLIQVSASSLAQKVTLRDKSVSLEKVFWEIRKQTGFDVVVNNTNFKISRKIAVDFVEAPLEKVLDVVVAGSGMTYVIDNKTVLIREKGLVPASVIKSPVIDVRGKVVDKDGKPIVGANVQIKGTEKAVRTDEQGEFEIKGLPTDAVLVISFLGFESREVDAKQNLNAITLVQSLSKLDEVQVIAYGTTTKRLSTGTSSTIKANELSTQPISNPLAGLQGRLSGLFITQTNGLPGGNFEVLIRGRNSISSGNEPYYIIDGVPYNSTSLTQGFGANGAKSPLNSINPADIESIDILKDADATAIYGSRGANGVILITTKQGKDGKTGVSVKISNGIGEVARVPKYLNSAQYIEMRQEAYKNAGTVIPSTSPDLRLFDQSRNTNWPKEILGNSAKYMDAGLEVSGGNELTKFRIGTGFFRETTVFPTDAANKRFSTQLRLNNTAFNNNLKLDFSINYSYDTNNLPIYDASSYVYAVPNAPTYDAIGNIQWYENGGAFSGNPFAIFKQIFNARNENLISSTNIDYSFSKNIKLKLAAGYSTIKMDEVATTPLIAMFPGFNSASGTSQFSKNNFASWIVEPQLVISGKVLGNNTELLFGTTLQNDERNGSSQFASNYSNESFLNSTNGAANISTSSNGYEYRYMAIYGRLNYNLNQSLFFNLTGRRDGSSRFGTGKQFANFGAIGVGWIFSNLHLLKENLSFLSFGKLRASFGVTGNDKIGDYQFLDLFSTTTFPYQGVSGYQTSRLANSNFRWESNKKLDIGLDLGFLKDKLTIAATYFTSRSNNLLLQDALSSQTGFTGVIRNLGAIVNNNGFEIELTSHNIKTVTFNWKSSFNFTLANNRLVDYPNLRASTNANRYVIGESLSVVKLLQYKGIDPNSGVYTFNGTTINDRTVLKNLDPKFYGGIVNTISWKGLDASFHFQFVKRQGYSYLNTLSSAPGIAQNVPIQLLDRWTQPGDVAKFQAFSLLPAAATAFNNYKISDAIITDASFIKLKNLSIGYSFSENLRKKANINNFRLFLEGQNLLVITNYKVFDPEVRSTTMPPLRVISAGLQLTF